MGNPKKRISVSNRLFLIKVKGETVVANLNSMAFCASGASDNRIWGERRPHLGRATTASGTRDGRTTSQIRRQVVSPDFHVIGSEVW